MRRDLCVQARVFVCVVQYMVPSKIFLFSGILFLFARVSAVAGMYYVLKDSCQMHGDRPERSNARLPK